MICHCEIFPVGVSDDYYEDITLHDILFFVASIEKKFTFRFVKKIDKCSDKNVSLPQASARTITITLPFHGIATKMVLALKFRVEFGKSFYHLLIF